MVKTGEAASSSPASPAASSAARQRILDTADRLFYNDGIHAVGIQRIVEEAAVTRVTLYRHFASKDDLIAAYLQGRVDYDRNQISGLIAANPNDPRSVLTELATALTRDDFAATDGVPVHQRIGGVQRRSCLSPLRRRHSRMGNTTDRRTARSSEPPFPAVDRGAAHDGAHGCGGLTRAGSQRASEPGLPRLLEQAHRRRTVRERSTRQPIAPNSSSISVSRRMTCASPGDATDSRIAARRAFDGKKIAARMPPTAKTNDEVKNTVV